MSKSQCSHLKGSNANLFYSKTIPKHVYVGFGAARQTPLDRIQNLIGKGEVMAGSGGHGGGMGPRVLQVLEFAQARAPELQALRELAHDPRALSAADEKLLTQKNQRRRRANAFNSFRMPQRLKQRGGGGRRPKSAQDEEEGDQEKRCRTHERRTHKLLAQRSWETAPAIGKAVLLPTHVWHAKRMKMQDRHGVVTAERRADKSVSAALEVLLARGRCSRGREQDAHVVTVRLVLVGTPQDGGGARRVVLRRPRALWAAASAARSAAARVGPCGLGL